MDDRHPKRRKDKYNPYTLSMIDGKCYLSFRDGQGVPHRLELDVKLYMPCLTGLSWTISPSLTSRRGTLTGPS